MVTGVNPSLLATSQAPEAALANRSAGAPGSQTGATDNAPTSADPAATYAGSGPPDLGSVLSVQDALNRAASISDVGIGAGQSISGLLQLLRQTVTAAQGATTDTQKATLNSDYQALLGTIDQTANSAAFQGVKMLDGSASSDLRFKADANGGTTLSLTPQDFTVGGPVIGLAAGDLLGSSADLASLLDQIDAASGALGAQLSQMTAQSTQIQGHLGAVTQLSDLLASSETTDLDADGARLMALQVQQALQGGQAQSLASQGPQALLSLFRA